MSMNSFHRRSTRPAPRPGVEQTPVQRQGVRSDVLLVELGLAPSRATAQRLIAAGRTLGPTGPVVKAAQEWPPGTTLRLLEDD